jgi:hypothetical protein
LYIHNIIIYSVDRHRDIDTQYCPILRRYRSLSLQLIKSMPSLTTSLDKRVE